MSERRKVELLDEKLAHYNKWLWDTKRPFDNKVYPGFPKQKELDVLCGLTAEEAPVKTKKVVRAVSGETKLDKARALFKANIKLSRENMIGLFMEKLQMSKAGATTYFYNVQK